VSAPLGLRFSVKRQPRHGCTTRRLALAAVALVLFGVRLVPVTPAGAASLSDCTAHKGTVVAVDFAHWGGPIVRGCGIDQPSGYVLLHAAGFTTAGDAHDGAAFVCRIGNRAFHGGTMYPTPSADPCIATPSPSAYWSYWLAPAGQNTWTYSPVGPMGDVPKPGEVELYMFGSTNVGGTRGSGVPKFPPSSLRAGNGAPPRHRPPTPTSTAPRTATHPASAPARRRKAAHATTGKRLTGARRRRSRARPSKRPEGSMADRRPVADSAPVVAAQPTGAHSSSGSAVPLVVSLCLALALSGGAVWAVRRRRRYG
jgi:hypothetical protein